MRYSTIVGIDTHSKKNAVCAIVPETGEMREAVLRSFAASLAS